MSKVVIVYIMTLLFCSCNFKGRHNIAQLKKVKVGMHILEVTSIMGKPYTTHSFPDTLTPFLEASGNWQLVYEAPFGYSDDIYITVRKSDSLVLDKSDGSE